MTEQPDLTLYKLIHKGMQADTARLAACSPTPLAASPRPTAPDELPALVRWYDGFFHDFELHHAAKDELFFLPWPNGFRSSPTAWPSRRPPMKVIWLATRGRYARLAQKALGGDVRIRARVAA
jgi:hypothetical protein